MDLHSFYTWNYTKYFRGCQSVRFYMVNTNEFGRSKLANDDKKHFFLIKVKIVVDKAVRQLYNVIRKQYVKQ